MIILIWVFPFQVSIVLNLLLFSNFDVGHTLAGREITKDARLYDRTQRMYSSITVLLRHCLHVRASIDLPTSGFSELTDFERTRYRSMRTTRPLSSHNPIR
jgi:hypothetical protein